MKTESLPSQQFEPELRHAVERELEEAENLSDCVEPAVREGIVRRGARNKFVARGFLSHDQAVE